MVSSSRTVQLATVLAMAFFGIGMGDAALTPTGTAAARIPDTPAQAGRVSRAMGASRRGAGSWGVLRGGLNGGSPLRPGALHGGAVAGGSARTNLALSALVMATVISFLKSHSNGGMGASAAMSSGQFASGLLYSGLALVGNTGVSALRKMLGKHVGSAQQVGVASLVQGVAAFLLLLRSGSLSGVPTATFWISAVASSLGNALVKTLETRAFTENDMSLCAPFLAFDPVMQFLVGVAVLPALCSMMGFGCDEVKSRIPLYHVTSVVTIAAGAFALAKAGAVKRSGAPIRTDSERVNYLGPLPLGSWFILFNCVIYGFTSRLDKAAIGAANKEIYYMYGRLIMAFSTLSGSRATGNLTTRDLSRFLQPKPLALLSAICAADAVYMLSLYKAMTLISPVYVTAIKRGGGVLLSSLIGALFFGEATQGRLFPILIIMSGVVALCIPA